MIMLSALKFCLFSVLWYSEEPVKIFSCVPWLEERLTQICDHIYKNLAVKKNILSDRLNKLHRFLIIQSL